MNRQVWTWGVLCVGLLSAACDVKVGEQGLSVDFAVGRATDEWNRTYTIQPGGRLDIVNQNGSIHVSPSSGGTVELRAVREVHAGSEDEAREILRKTEMREEVTPDRVSVQAPEEPRPEGPRRGQRMNVRYEVRVPSGLTLMFRTQNGEVRVENIEGRVTAASTNGAITGVGLTGSIEASTVNGGIQMDLAGVTSDSRMVTVNGGVRLSVPSGINADLDATVVNGGVSVESGLGLSASESSRQRVAGRLNKGGPRIVVQTTNGGVRIDQRSGPGA